MKRMNQFMNPYIYIYILINNYTWIRWFGDEIASSFFLKKMLFPHHSTPLSDGDSTP